MLHLLLTVRALHARTEEEVALRVREEVILLPLVSLESNLEKLKENYQTII